MEAIDIRAAIERVAPGAKWRWLGGAWDDYSQLVWEDQVIPKPSLAALQTAWQQIQDDRQQADTTLQNVKSMAQSAVGVSLNQLDNNQIKALLAVLLWQRGAIANDATIKPLNEWLE